ncbi:hypothetical protein [uncultured Gammaproteobacteria bacterium]|nr:hypothetical protein [uncultured Gammaproteobacteria bacterium]
MNNHIHLILQPTTKEGLQKVLKPLHMRYSQYINKQQNITGILWQGRFFSSPLDEQYTYYGFAYVENNPVKAKMVENATDYKYSSAMCHAGLVNNSLVTDYDIGVLPSEYQDYLKSMVGVQHDKTLKINTHKGLPCGNEGFIRKLSDKVGRDLSFKKRGRPKKG